MNIFQRLVQDAQQKKQQFEQSIGQAVHPAAVPPPLPRQGQAGFGVVRPGAPVMPQPAPHPLSVVPQVNLGVGHAIGQVGKAFGLGLERAGTGLAQDASGLVDLATPGTGTSRFTKATINAGKSLDQRASQIQGPARTGYKIGQISGNVASFIGPGEIAAGARGAGMLPKAFTLGDRAIAPAARIVDSAAARLAARGAGGRIAAAGVKGIASPAGLINAGVGTAGSVGNMASKGQQITPAKVAEQAGINLATAGAIPIAARGAAELTKAVVPGTKLVGKVAADAVHNADLRMNSVEATKNDTRILKNQSKAVQQRINQLPPGSDSAYAQNNLQAKLDNLNSRIGQNKSSLKTIQNPLQRVTDRIVTARPGLSMKAVNEEPTSDVPSTTPKPQLPSAAKAVPGTPASTVPQLKSEASQVNGTPKTGIVDKHLNDMHSVRKQILASEADDILANHNAKLPPENLYQKVLDSGGISTKSSDFPELPVSVRRNSGSGIDQVAQELGYPDEHALYDDLLKYRDRPQPMTREQSKEIARQNLDSGSSPYSQDWQDIHSQIASRQAELSRYPQGTRQQVKVLDKPAPMTDAELQSLSQTPEGKSPKTTNNVLQRNDKKLIRNPDAERQVQEVLTKGGSTDEALHTYMKATGTDLQTAVRDVRRVAADSGLGFTGGKNPLEGTVKVPTVQAGDADQAFLNADYVKQHEHSVGSDALKAFHGLSDHDKTLLQDIETDTVPNVAKRADNPQAFTDAEKAIRTYYDTRHAYDKYLGIDVGYRKNYLRQLFAKAEDTAATTDQTPIKAGNKRPGYTKERSKDTLHTEVGNALERDINGASANHARLAYAKGLGEAFPRQINDTGQLVRDANGNHLQLTNRYGQGLTANKDIANQLNRRTWSPDTNKALATYDKANAGIKYIKLGGGAFHALTEAGNFVGQQISSGKFFKDPAASGKVFKTFFSPKTMGKEMDGFRTRGTLDNAALSGLKVQPHEILADANVKLGGKISKYSGIQALHDATFAREIPYAKLKMFEQGTQGLDPHNPADLKVMRQQSREINQIFGGINRDIQGITPAAFKRLQRFVLATDFTESKIHTAFDAVTDLESPAGILARQTVIGKALLFAGVAAGLGAVGGEFQGKSPAETARNIIGKIADPSFTVGKYKVGLPATHISEFTKPLSPLFRTDGGDRFSGLQRYGTNRLAAIPSEALQLRTNKDASGSRIYGKDYKANGGKPISAGKTALNVTGGFVPIPVAQGIGVGTGKTNIPSAIANTVGLRVSDPSQYTTTKTSGNTPVDKLKATEKQQNIDLKNSLSAEDYKLSQLSKADRQKLINDGSYTADKFKGLDNYVASEQKKLGMKVGTASVGVSTSISPHSQKVLNEYNTLDAATKKSKAYNEPDYDYKVAQAKYDNAKANGTLTKAQQISQADSVAKAKVGSSFSKDTRDLYGLSKQEVYNLITQDNNGNQIASDLLAYGDALKSAGIEKNKFRTSKGVESFGDGTNSATKAASGTSLSTLLAGFKTPYSDTVKNTTKGASLARNAHLVKKKQVA